MDALLVDLDGVLTPTADTNMRAWANLFTPFLRDHGSAPYSDADYFTFIDGRPRYDGVRALLAARSIAFPGGHPDDSADAETVCGLGNRKNALFEAEVRTAGVVPYSGSVAFCHAATAAGMRVAVVSSSKNAVPVLTAANLLDRFAVIVDGVVAATEGFPGKPAPGTYIEAARLLGVPLERCTVVEDAVSGIQAGTAAPFGLVIGVDRGTSHAALFDAGADIVVDNLAQLIPHLRLDTKVRTC